MQLKILRDQQFSALLRTSLLAVLCAIAAFGASPALAGQECGERPPATPQAIAKGLELGQRVREQLERSGASMALVARIGMDLSEFGQRYTHMGVALRDPVRNRWVVMHLYNACGKGESEIKQQALEQFYETDLFVFEALVLQPSYAPQNALRNAFMNPQTSKQLHQKAYNLIAHPFRTEFQNSNQWILEMSAFAFEGTGALRERAIAQKWLQAQSYEPAAIRIPNLRRSAARLFSANVRFSDHSQEEFEKQSYQVVTVESIVRFLQQVDPGLLQQTVR